MDETAYFELQDPTQGKRQSWLMYLSQRFLGSPWGTALGAGWLLKHICELGYVLKAQIQHLSSFL